MIDEQQYQQIDPRKMLWAGTLADIGGFMANPFTHQFQGLGPRYMMQAEQFNRQSQQLGQRNQRMIAQDRRAQTTHDQQTQINARTLNQEPNPYGQFPAAEQQYRQWLQSSGMQDSAEARAGFAEYARSSGMASTVPARIQNAEWYTNATPEQQHAYDQANTAWRPEEAFMEGRYDPQAYEREQGYGRSMGVKSAEQHGALVDTVGPMRATLANYYRVRELVKGAKTGPAAEYNAIVDSELQTLQSQLESLSLGQVATARAAGVTFGAMTTAEWEKMDKTVARLKNFDDANVDIIDMEIAKLERMLGNTSWALENFKPGELRPLRTTPVQGLPNKPGGAPTQRPQYNVTGQPEPE